MNATTTSKNVQLVCPVCKSEKNLSMPESFINQSKNLTILSIPNGLMCDHHFQAFVDKQFKVRGYQKVDFELKTKNAKKGKNWHKLSKQDQKLFENLISEGNFLEYNPKKNDDNLIREDRKEISVVEKHEMTLEEIYEEFWEFINDDNYEFRELILKDETRRKALKSES